MPEDYSDQLQQMEQEQSNIEEQNKQVMLNAERKKKRRELDRRIMQLCQRAISFEDQYGEEDYRTQILITFLDVTMQMKSVIDLLNDVGFAMQCIGQAIDCVDDVLNMQQEVLAATMSQKYGFWERMRRKRQVRRAIRNNAARMNQMCEMLVSSQRIALEMVNSLKTVSVRMKTMSQKGFAKQSKKNKGVAPEQENSYAKKLMADMRASSAPKNAGNAPAPQSNSGDNGGGKPDGNGNGNGGGVGDIGDIA